MGSGKMRESIKSTAAAAAAAIVAVIVVSGIRRAAAEAGTVSNVCVFTAPFCKKQLMKMMLSLKPATTIATATSNTTATSITSIITSLCRCHMR